MTGLAPEIQERLAALGRIRALRRGERLIHEGLASGGVVLVLDGTVRISRVVGGEEIVLAIRGPGDLLGEIGPLTSGTARATVEAREAGRVVVMPASRFVTAQRDDPELASAVLARLVELLGDSDRRLVNARCKPLAGRVAEELLALAAATGSNGGRAPAEFPVTQSELASLCVASRSNVARAVGELRGAGLIETRRGRVSILDPDGLGRTADAVGPPD